MARYIGPKERIERRIGQKLFLKGERSYSQKSAMVKKPYPPGVHGKTPRRLSEYGFQLLAKQKVRNIYRVLEKQFKKYFKEVLEKSKPNIDLIVQKLERRLDNVVFRLGFAKSRDSARQLVTHSHFLVNDKLVNIPSFQTKVGDVIKLKNDSLKNIYFSSILPQYIKKYQPPNWLELDKEKLIGKVKRLPTIEESGLDINDLQTIIEFYSR